MLVGRYYNPLPPLPHPPTHSYRVYKTKKDFQPFYNRDSREAIRRKVLISKAETGYKAGKKIDPETSTKAVG